MQMPRNAPPPGMTRREWRRRFAAELPVQIAADPMPTGAPTILTVCTGNICRSPLAEVLLRARLEPYGVRVHSAGTFALAGHGMPRESKKAALLRGAHPDDVEAHRARHLREPLVMESDLVLGMTQEHRGFTVQLVPSRLHRVFSVLEFARLASMISDAEATRIADSAGADPRARLGAVVMAVSSRRGGAAEDADVVDPYRQSSAVYEQSAAQLDPALAEVERLVRAVFAHSGASVHGN